MNVPPIGGLPDWFFTSEKADRAEFPPQAATHSRRNIRKGTTELRKVFRLGGQLEILDDDGVWYDAVIVKMGQGKIIAEYRLPEAEESKQRQIALGDSFVRPRQRLEPEQRSNVTSSLNSGRRLSTPPLSSGRRKSMSNSPPSSARRSKVKFPSPSPKKSSRSPSPRPQKSEQVEQRLEDFEDDGKRRLRTDIGVDDTRLREDAQEHWSRTAIQLTTEAPGHQIAQLRLERVKAAFRVWDIDCNGFISKDELSSIFQDLGLPTAQTGKLFDGIDSNADGQLDFNEFFSWLLK